MKTKIFNPILATVLTIVALCGCSGNPAESLAKAVSEKSLSDKQRAELIVSKTAEAFKGIDLQNDEEGFSAALDVLEKGMDAAYNCYETDSQKHDFNLAFLDAVTDMDAPNDVKGICSAHVKAY